MLLISGVIVLLLALYCLSQGLMLAALTALLGLIPGPGFLPLIICAVILFIEGKGWIAVLPLLIIAWNIWAVFRVGQR